MNQLTYFTNADGEEMAVLPRAELEQLFDAIARAREVAAYDAGHVPGLDPAEALAFAEAASPLAFWRERAGVTLAELADRAGTSESVIAGMETGEQDEPVGLWLKLAAALSVPVEAIIDEE